MDNCILTDDCINSYMNIGDKSYSCRIVDGVCLYNEYQCVKNLDTSTIYILTSFLYIFLTYLHYSARRFLMIQRNIEPTCSDCCAITCCVSCGLAQEYRELP